GSRTVAFEHDEPEAGRRGALGPGTLRSYVGGWPEYLRVREERAAKPRAADKARSFKAKATARPAKPGDEARPAKPGDERRLEAEIEAAEAALRALEHELSDPAAWADPRRTADSAAKHEQAKRAVQELYARWEQVAAG
ncbi:MAG: ATP-binding cassette, subfamily er 3, partial [Solirubrobacteraceae bacterium]|nr:ATP-binding cassette, subfamily er 3 [Solirubrobacteraceae bacterium]